MTTTTAEATCAGCGNRFESQRLLFEGRVIAAARFCNPCVEKNELSRAIERDQREAARLAEAWERICPPLYRDTDLQWLHCPKATKDLVLAWEYGPKGLLLHGPARSGKTRLVYLLLSRLHHLEKRRIIALTATGFSHEVSARFGAGGGRGEDFIKRLSEIPVLFVDDFGKGRLTDRVEAEFFHIIEARTTHLRPTFLTTNLNSAALRTLLSPDRAEPFLGRLHEFFETVAVLCETTQEAGV